MTKVKCEICHIKTSRSGDQKRLFMAKFPLDEIRCKKWVAVTGNIDLAYVPIEKLHQLKYVCGKHFRSKDFCKKKNQLRKRAVPCIELPIEPLPDDVLKDFPCRIAKIDVSDSTIADHNYCNTDSEQNEDYARGADCAKDATSADNANSAIATTCAGITTVEDNIDAETEIQDCPIETDEQIFSWQRDSEINCDDFDVNQVSDMSEDITQRNARNCKKYYSRKKSANQVVVKKKTNSEKCRQYRQRKKLLAQQLQSKNEVIHTPSTSSLQMTFDPQLITTDTSTIVENVTELDDIVVKTELDDSLSLHGPESQTGEQVFKASEENDVHEGYRCDMCSGPIHRFRYSCVECANYDLCSACEASRGHPEHYLVRIPRPRPHGEIQLIMDTIRRFLTADLKALRTEVNFVDTLINEMKSEVSSEAGSDPVPDEPDYPVESSDDEDDGMEETIDTHSQDALETQDESQDITWLDEDILQDSELQETSDNLETIENNPDTISADTTIKLNSEHPQRPEKRKVNNTDEVKPITLGKVKKRVLINMPKKVSISNDAFELIKAKHGDPMERTINTIKHSLQSNVSIRLQRLSKEDLEAVTNSNK